MLMKVLVAVLDCGCVLEPDEAMQRIRREHGETNHAGTRKRGVGVGVWCSTCKRATFVAREEKRWPSSESTS